MIELSSELKEKGTGLEYNYENVHEHGLIKGILLYV